MVLTNRVDALLVLRLAPSCLVQKSQLQPVLDSREPSSMGGSRAWTVVPAMSREPYWTDH